MSHLPLFSSQFLTFLDRLLPNFLNLKVGSKFFVYTASHSWLCSRIFLILSYIFAAYHTKCIDPWLTRNRRVCPICKRKVFAADELPDDCSETDSDTDNDERTPLVRPDGSQHRQPRRVCHFFRSSVQRWSLLAKRFDFTLLFYYQFSLLNFF